MKLPLPKDQYDRQMIDSALKQIENADLKNMKTDVANVLIGGDIILQSADGDYWRITVDNDGTIGTETVGADSEGKPITSVNPYA